MIWMCLGAHITATADLFAYDGLPGPEGRFSTVPFTETRPFCRISSKILSNSRSTLLVSTRTRRSMGPRDTDLMFHCILQVMFHLLVVKKVIKAISACNLMHSRLTWSRGGI